jgi:hypothetical protein
MRGITRRGSSAALVLVLLAGCGLLAEPPVAASTLPISSKVLKLSDLPAGWSVDNSSSGATIIPCLANLKKVPKGVPRASVSYRQASSVPELGETLETGPGSINRWNAFNRGFSKCKTFSVKQNGKTATGTVGAMSFPKVGDQSSAYAMTLLTQGVTLGIDIILFRVGSYVGDLLYADLGSPDLSRVQSLTTEAIAKINGQPTTSPATSI